MKTIMVLMALAVVTGMSGCGDTKVSDVMQAIGAVPKTTNGHKKAEEMKMEPCAPGGCTCFRGVWHGRDGKPSTLPDGRTIYCCEVNPK